MGRSEVNLQGIFKGELKILLKIGNRSLILN